MRKTHIPTAVKAVVDAKAARDAGDVALLQMVVEWAVEYRVDDSVVDDLTFGVDGVILGGVGCPLVDEFAAYDLAAVMGMSSEGGCGYIAKTLELRYRLRRIWEQVVALKVPVWKAFRVCEHTLTLSFEAARYVDQMLAPTLRSCSYAQIERTVAQAIDLYDPEEAERRRRKAADDRDFQIHLGQRNNPTDGTVDVTGTLSTEDALDLEAAVKQGAKTLGDLGCGKSLGARRSMAVGEMARQQLTLDLEAGGDTGGRGVVIYAHIDADSPHATLDNIGGGDVLIEQLKGWCQTAGTTVTIKPVIDLNQEISTSAYVPTAKLVEQVRLRDQCCVFPNCTRRAEHCDLDHRIPFNKNNPAAGGSTSTSNLSLLCRKHHRAKTFSTWTYTSPQPGVYDWTSPSGHRFRVTRGRRHGRMPVTTPLDDPPEP
ncbi:HNH endonuclease signature motif containing protein [Nocardioides sp.]|uniref:HNH endonuclease signature motif containing protein n=1 Tax=Nocardioides sp. TaxID=35761 RepID=UPI002B26602D|nr:HNH endonuclease signature motif containing protein [Nocardioides sp.]